MEKEFFRERKRTTIVFYFLFFLYGMERSCVLVSLLFYLQDDLKMSVSEAKTYYSWTLAVYAANAAVIGIFTGRYTDRTRNVKKTLLMLFFISIVGNIIYTMEFSIWCIILGRLLCGCVGSANANVSGELSRCYNRKELGPVLYWNQIFYATGYSIGPSTAALFTNVNFSYGSFRVSPNNFVGIFMALILLVMTAITMFGVTDISRKYPQGFTWTESGAVEVKEVEEPDGKYRELSIVEFITNSDLMVLTLLSAILEYQASSNETLVNMIAVLIFKMDTKVLSATTTSSVLLFLVLMILVLRKQFAKAENNVYSMVICVYCVSTACWCFVLPKLLPINDIVLQCILVAVPVIISSVSIFSQFAIARQILFRIVPKNSVCFAEGLRIAFVKDFLFLGYVSSSFTFTYMQYVVPFNICVISLLGFLFVRKRNVFGNLYPSLDKYLN